MYRRQYLGGGAVGVTAALAGCLDALGSSGAAEPDDRTVPRAVARAVGSLNEAALALDVRDDLESDGDVEFDPEPARALIAEARGHLETVADETDDRTADVEALTAHASALEALIDVTATLTDGSIEDDADGVGAALEDEERLDPARERVTDRLDDLDGARERFDEALATLRDLDAERLEALAVIDLEEIEAGTSALEDVLTSLESLLGATDATLGGYERLLVGRERLEEREYDPADEAFSDAGTSFADAGSRVADGPADDREDLVERFERTRRQTDHLTDAATCFGAATTAAKRGDPATARRKRSEGEAALDEARATSSE